MSKHIMIRSSVEEFLTFKSQEKDDGIYLNMIKNY